jgi:hypothetical protein
MRLVKVACMAVALACGRDPIGPDGLTDMQLDYCAGLAPTFFAYQNEGEAWKTATADANGTLSFRVSPKFKIASIDPASVGLTVLFTTVDDVAALNGTSCHEPATFKILGGTTANVPAGSRAGIAMWPASIVIGSSQYQFEVAATPQDLVAHREVFSSPNRTPNRVIVRRQLNVTGTIPVLDFGAPEAQALDTRVGTIVGLTAGGLNAMGTDFITSQGTRASIAYEDRFTTASRTIHTVPGGLTIPGDMHLLFVAGGNDTFNDVRVVHAYFRTTIDQTITLGPNVGSPTVTVAATAPYTQLRMVLPRQSEYPRFVSILFSQLVNQFEARLWRLQATESYADGTDWDLTMPDLSEVTGFPAILGFVGTTGINRELLLVSSVRAAFHLAEDRFVAEDGEIFRFAYEQTSQPTSLTPLAALLRHATRGEKVSQ